MRCFECLHPYLVGLHLLHYVPSTVYACPAPVVEVLPHAFLPQCIVPGLLAVLLAPPFWLLICGQDQNETEYQILLGAVELCQCG